MPYLVSLIMAFILLLSWQFIKHQALQEPTLEVKIGRDVSSSEENATRPQEQEEELTKDEPISPPLIPAFPEAQGGGAYARGGRGGKVYVVTNLHDRGEGSLRYGLEKLTGPRTIVFAVGGYIHLSYPIVVDHDGFITIAGQTASGDGITLTTIQSKEPVLIFRHAHDIILRYLRIRKGGTKAQGQHGSGLVISRGGENIIVDHCSVSWTGDDNINIWADASGEEGLRNITIQNSISAEGLNYGHPGTSLIAGGSAFVEKMENISIHHNFFANNKNRNPLLKVASGEIINNLVYNWSWWATGIGGGIRVDIIGNYYQAGPLTRHRGRGEVLFKPYDPQAKTPEATGVLGNPSIYFEGNVGPHHTNPLTDGWNAMIERVSPHWGYPLRGGKPKKASLELHYRRRVRQEHRFPVTVHPATTLPSMLLAEGGVGASQRLQADGSWVVNRDLVDRRLIQEFHKGEGKLVQTVDDVGGWVVYEAGRYRYVSEAEMMAHLDRYLLDGGTPYRDHDQDGMPDVWERLYHLDPNNPDDAIEDQDGDGYENLEEFLNGTTP